jgi:hypothetical protein
MLRATWAAPSAVRGSAREHVRVLPRLPLIVVCAMAVASTVAGQRDFIFPEGAALALGIGVLRIPDWSTSRWRIATLPPACAVIGHMLSVIDGPPWALEITGLTAALLLLQCLGSRIAPAISAAALPVVFGVHSWAYPVVVLATCLVVIAALPPDNGGATTAAEGSWPRATAFRFWLITCAWIGVADPMLSLPAAALAPPLFVSALEWINTPGRSFAGGIRRYALIGAAAIAGVVAAQVSPAEGIAAPTAVAMTLVLMNITHCWHAPALAISLVPGIAAGVSPASFIAGIGVGAAALYLAASTVGGAHQSSMLKPVATRLARSRSS